MAFIILEAEALIWGIKANILRSDFNPMEKSNALHKLLDIKTSEAKSIPMLRLQPVPDSSNCRLPSLVHLPYQDPLFKIM